MRGATQQLIKRITLYRVELPLHEGSYRWAGSKSISVFDATVVRIETRSGHVGYGENTPLGSAYLPAHAKGTRAGLEELAPSLIGKDATKLNMINQTMDGVLKGHPHVKAAVDMACFDILGKHSGLPVCELLGGRFDDSFPLYRAISQGTPAEMAASVDKYLSEGYRKFQLKVGGRDVAGDIERIRRCREVLDTRAGPGVLPLFCDANTGWLMHEAMQVCNAVASLPATYIEQPCLTYNECLSVRKHTSLPFILDECVDDVHVLNRIIQDRAADCINLKISKVGGLSKARVIRDLCVQHGIAMNIEDSWGGDLVTAAIAALAQSTPPHLLLCSTDFNSYGPVKMGRTTCRRSEGGRLSAPLEPGLGVDIDEAVLGRPLFNCEE